MLSINTNIPALYAANELDRIADAVNKSIRKLATGKRITTASDDPSAVKYLERIKAYKIGWETAYSNIEQSGNLISAAEEALSGINGISDILQRIRELALEAANTSTLTTDDLEAIQEEIESLIEEIDRISNITEYNTKKLLDGSMVAHIASSSPYVYGYATGKVQSATYEFSGATAATEAIIYTAYPLPDTQKMPLAFDDTYDATRDLGEAVFSVAATAATFNADYDIIFTPGNSSYDYIVYRTSTGETVGYGTFGTAFSDPSNPGATITIYSGTQTIQEGYKGIWHADTVAANNAAQEGNRVVTGTITLGDLSDRAILNATLTIEFDFINNKLSYRVVDEEGNPLGSWVSVGATFYSYADSKLKGSYFTLNINATRAGYSGLAGKGDKWNFTFKEYDSLTSSGSVLIEIGTSSYTFTWQGSDTVDDIKLDIENLIGDKVTVVYTSSGSLERLKIVSKDPGSENTPNFSDSSGNLVIKMGFSLVSGTGTDAFITINGKTYGPQSSNIFLGAIENVAIILKQGAENVSGIINVVDKSQKIKASPSKGGNITFYILPINSFTLGLKDEEGNIKIDVTTSKGAEAALDIIDRAISKLSSEASRLGAVKNRLNRAQNLADSMSLIFEQARSTIEDVDTASELVTLTTLEIKRDLATAMLSHANIQPERVFKILFEAKD